MGDQTSKLNFDSERGSVEPESCALEQGSQEEMSAHKNEHVVFGPGPEAAESERGWRECVKNPGHKNFIPVGELGIKHLPVGWQSFQFLKLIQVLASLTVRLRVRGTSPARPDDGGYYGVDGDGPRVGTGFLFDVWPVAGPCLCVRCEGKKGEDQRVWRFHIRTAKHVVYDDFEVKRTTVDLFFDDEESRDDGRMKLLTGETFSTSPARKDYSNFVCVCHDDKLGAEIKSQMDSLKHELKLFHDAEDLSAPERPVVFVSHPHGRPKQVTVGHWTYNHMSEGFLKYTTDTCPGSSGAGGFVGCKLYGNIDLVHCQGGGTDRLNTGQLSFVY